MRRFRNVNTRRMVASAAAALVVATGIGSVVLATIAQAAPKTPTPSVTSGPSGSTASSSATFTFTDSASPAVFLCAVDSGLFLMCASPKTYAGLSDGTHSFSVNATTPGKSVSDAATRTWTVDTRPPAISATGPAGSAAYNAAGWAALCSGGGICGTATDPGGVSQVTVAVLQQSTGRYWNGSAFSSTTPTFNAASGTATWRYGLARPSDGTYTASVRAKDALSNVTSAAEQVNVTFVIDTMAPVKPALTNTPDDPTDKTTAQFNWASSESGLVYRCALDGATASSCSSAGIEYKSLAVGDHCFSLVGLDAAGNTSASTTYCWSVLLSGGFQITGNTLGLLAPGASQPVNLVITNPLNFAIQVMSVSITISSTSTKPGCSTSTNFVVTHSLVGSVTIPANSTRSLDQLGIARSNWPLVAMQNLNSDQNACKNATVTLSYTGTAAKA